MGRWHVAIAALAVALSGQAGDAKAQGYPNRIIEMIVPSPPGASADILGRVLAEGMSAYLGQTIVILNKPGAGGMIGTAAVARNKADGYTLMHGAAVSLTVAPLTEKDAGYTYRSFDPICQTFKNDQVIVARPNTYRSVADILTASKAKLGGLNYGTTGLGTIPHLAMIELGQITKTAFNHIPFRGPAESVQMAHAGQVDFTVSPLTAAATSGLAMPGLFAPRRNPAIPDVPTVKEQGYDVAPLSFGALVAPAGLPADVKQKLDTACRAAAQGDAYRRVAKSHFQPDDYYGDGAAAAAAIAKDVEDKRRLLTQIGMIK
jgi:tripartite-type tricarboxylate transporter receptor subunit TctC